MSLPDNERRDERFEQGTEGTLGHGKEHLSPRRADQQDSPAEVRPTTPVEEAGERKGDEEGGSGSARRGP